jgi:hypothetical protein
MIAAIEQQLPAAILQTGDCNMVGTLIGRLGTGYGLLLTLAAAGLVFAKIAGFLGAAIEFGAKEAPDGSLIQAWSQGGWVFGVCFGLFVIATGMWKKRKETERGEDSTESRAKGQRRWQRAPQITRRYGRLASTVLGGLGGAILGGMLGGTFLLIWFSITYSPFAPTEWVSSLSVERQPAGSGLRTTPATTTNHPIALIAFGAPLLLGALTGAVLGGIAGVTEEK